MSESNSWYIDPVTRDYVLTSTGDPVNDTTLKTPSYIRLSAERLNWLYAPDTRWGSDFNLIKRNHDSSTATVLINTAQAALAPIVNDGRASDTEVTILQQTRNAGQLDITVTDAQGKQIELIFNPIGV